MRLFHNKVRCRKRSTFVNATISAVLSTPVLLVLLFVVGVVEGDTCRCRSLTSSFLLNQLGSVLLSYSVIPYFTSAKSIRNGKEVEDASPSPDSALLLPSPEPTWFASRSLQVSENATSSEEDLLDLSVDASLDSSKMTLVKEYQKSKAKRRSGGRLKRQMGLAQEIALIAPALQTMGCIPKFFCGLNSKPPSEGSSALNDLAYLIKFAMLDDDDVDHEPLFTSQSQSQSMNNKGKDGLQGLRRKKRPFNKIKDDLILENMAEEELIQEDPANLPFVWQDMEHRIKTKVKPGSKDDLDDDLLDAIIVQPEQSSVSALLTGIKSALRIGRSVENLGYNSSTLVSPRGLFGTRGQEWRRQNKRPFWRTPQFRQDMELAQRIGQMEQDDAKCSSTFKTCPYGVNEMMEIVHGGYKKKKKGQPEWFLNAHGPPDSSEEEIKKPFKDPENLVTTSTAKPPKIPTVKDPESQLYYMLFPHKAIEQGLTTVPTPTQRPVPTVEGDITIKRKPPMKIQSHVEYENDDESSKEPRPEQIDALLNLKKQPPRFPWRKPGMPPPVPHGKRPPRPPPVVFVHQISKEDSGPSSEEQKKGSSEVGAVVPQQVIILAQQPQGQSLDPFASNVVLTPSKPIALPRPKYKIQRKKEKKVRKPGKPSARPQSPTGQPVKTDKSSEEEDEEEDEGEEESQENSSEEKGKPSSNPVPASNGGPQNRPVLYGRPSEEIKEPTKEPGRLKSDNFDDDPDNSDEENSHSGPVEEDLISMELPNVPKPARPPHLRMNLSHEYAYSDEQPGRPQLRPINYSYFKGPHHSQPGSPPPIPPHQQQGSPEPTESTTTQKYSTGFLSFLFGKKKQKKVPANFENRPPQPNHRRNPDEDEQDDDGDNDESGSDELDEAGTRDGPPQMTAPDGKFEVGQLGAKPSPIKPNFKPPERPKRPFKGTTSMEDSDERIKAPRITQTRPTSQTTSPQPQSTAPKLPSHLGPILYIGKPHRIQIPPPATPPPRTPPTSPQPSTTTPKDSEEAASDEDKQSDESKESSEEVSKKSNKPSEPSSNKNSNDDNIPPPPPIANYDKYSLLSQTRPTSSTTRPVGNKGQNEYSEEKLAAEDSNQTKEDDSAEETKTSKETNSDEGSDEGSSEEIAKSKKRPPRPQRKPEDDELENRLPPLPPIIGEVAQVGDLLGPPPENHDDNDDPYGEDEDIPAPPPLAQGFAASLEIQVPTRAPTPVIAQKLPSMLNQAPPGGGQPGAEGVGTRNPSDQLQGVRNPGSSSSHRLPSRPNSGNNNNRPQQQRPGEGEKKENSSEEKSSEEKKDKSSEESEEQDVLKGVIQGFDTVALGPKDKDDDDDNENADEAEKQPPQPPPVFTGKPAQKLQIQNSQPFLPRPPSKLTFSRPPVLRDELMPHGGNPPGPPPGANPSQQVQRPAFSMSNLLRPLIGRPMYKRKPILDANVVNWIRESYGIPDLNNDKPIAMPHLQQPNRSGLQSQDVASATNFTSSSAESKKTVKKPDRIRNKSSETGTLSTEKRKPAIKNKSVEKTSAIKIKSSSERISTSNRTKLAEQVLITVTTTVEKGSAKNQSSVGQPAVLPTPSRKKLTSEKRNGTDYVTEDDEAKLAQALFVSSEEESNEESSESDEKPPKKLNSNNKSTEKRKLPVKPSPKKNQSPPPSRHSAKASQQTKANKLKQSKVQKSSSTKSTQSKKPVSKSSTARRAPVKAVGVFKTPIAAIRSKTMKGRIRTPAKKPTRKPTLPPIYGKVG